MVPDSITIQKMLSMCANATASLGQGRVPYLFIINDLREGLLELFDITEEKLNRHLGRFDDNIVCAYTTDQIRDLKRKSAEAQKYNIEYQTNIDYLTQLLETEFNLKNSHDIACQY